MPRKVIIWTVIVALNCNGIAWAGSAQSLRSDKNHVYHEALATSNRIFELIQELRNEIDRKQFDVDDLAFELAGEDPASIVSWVRENIAFEQYVGLLRGPQGTLVSRAGNALDQAVLLAKILKDAAFDARIVRGQLRPEQSRHLLEAMLLPRSSAPPFGNLDAIRHILAEIARVSGSEDPESLAASVFNPANVASKKNIQEVQRTTSQLMDLLQSSNFQLGDGLGLDSLTDEASDYFWVEYRDSSSGPWVAAHPAIPERELEGFESVKIDDIYVDSIPSELQHRVRVQVFVEQRRGANLSIAPITEAWERPAANLHGRAITFTNIPDEFSPDAAGNYATALEESTTFAPAFSGAVVALEKYFNLRGALIDPLVANNRAAGVFEKVGGAFGDAAGAIAGEENREDFAATTREWLEYTIVKPGGAEQVFRRDVFDRLSPEARQKGDIRLDGDNLEAVRHSLVRQFTFMVSAGRFTEGMMLDLSLKKFLANAPLLRLNMLRASNPEYPVRISPEIMQQIQSYWSGHDLLYDLLDKGTPDGFLSYRSAPSLIVHEQDFFIAPNEMVFAGIDIVTNARRSFDVSGAKLLPSVETNVLLGVWETFNEGRVLPPEVITRFGAAEVFHAARRAKIPLLVIVPDQIEKIDELELSVLTKRHLKDDLIAGNVVVVPTAPTEISEAHAWWRVDPKTGQTIGMGNSGRGTETTLYRIMLQGVGMAIISTLAWGACMTYIEWRERPDKQTTCLGVAGGTFALPYNVTIGAILLIATALVDVEVPPEAPPPPDCPKGYICRL